MGEAMLSKSLVQFSVDGQGCVPSLLFEKSGEITTERMKRQSQSKNNTQLWM